LLDKSSAGEQVDNTAGQLEKKQHCVNDEEALELD